MRGAACLWACAADFCDFISCDIGSGDAFFHSDFCKYIFFFNGVASLNGVVSIDGFVNFDGIVSFNGFGFLDGIVSINGFVFFDGVASFVGFVFFIFRCGGDVRGDQDESGDTEHSDL